MYAQAIFAATAGLIQASAAKTVSAVVCGDMNPKGKTGLFCSTDTYLDLIFDPANGEKGNLSKGSFNDRINSAVCK